MTNICAELKKELGENRLKKDIKLASYSTLRVGGGAKYFFEAAFQEDLIRALGIAKTLSLPTFILGGGSNLLISDNGFAGLVIKNKTNTIKVLGFKGSVEKSSSHIKDVYVEVESGVLINRLVRFALDEGLGGIESFLGQPGSVGGAVYINAHNLKNNDFFADHIHQAKIINNKGEEMTVSPSYFQFGYDQSLLQKTKETVLSVTLKLQKKEKAKLWEVAKYSFEYRKKTQPQGVLSSGCTFRNIDKSAALRLATPNFTTSAGYLIENVGLKGKKVGGAQISPSHANFIINLGRATGANVLELIGLTKEMVKMKFGVLLKEEVVLVGF